MGYGGEQKVFPISVNSKYALARIDWSASALLAQGGRIIRESSDRFSVQLPQYRSQGDNTYSMSAVAVDTQGNMSRSATTQVAVLQAEVSALNSSLEPENISLPANGKAQQRLTLKVRDLHGNPVDLDPSEIRITSKRAKRSADAFVVSALQRQSAGEYAATLTAGTQPTVFTLAPSARDITLATTHVILTADVASAAISGLDVETNNTVANGKSTNEIIVTVTDANGHRVPNVQIQLRADNDAVISATALTDAQGEAKVSLTSIRAGNTTVTAEIKGASAHQVTLVFQPDYQTAKVVELLPSAAPYLADGQSLVHYRALIKDAQGNPVPGVRVNWSSDRDASVVWFSNLQSFSNQEGIATTTLTSNEAFGVTVTASSPYSRRTAETILFTTGALSEANSLLRVYPTTLVAGKEKAVLLLVLRDKSGNPLAGQRVVAVSDKSNVVFSETTESAEGRYRIEVSSTHAQAVLLSVRVNDVPLSLTQPLA